MKLIKLVLLSFSLLLPLFTGCSSTETVKEEVEMLSSERLINKLEVNRRKVRNFEGNGTIQIQSKKMDNTADFVAVLIKPDSMKLSVTGPFGIELADILVSKKQFTFYQALNNTAYQGSINDDVIKNILKIDLKFNDLLDAFTGSINLSDKLYKKPDGFKVEEGNYIITYDDSSANLRYSYKIDIRDLGIREYLLTNLSNVPIMKTTNSKFKLVETVPVPQVTEILFYSRKESMKIEYEKFRINNKQLFIEFSIPEDADIVQW